MGASFFELALVVSALFAVTPLDREGSFTEVIAQVGVASAREMGVFGLKLSRTGFAPFEPGELGDFGLVTVKALDATDLSHNACG